MLSSDRRALERFSLDVPASLSVRVSPVRRIRLTPTHTRDISANGAFVYLSDLSDIPAVGTRVELELHLVIGTLPELVHVSPEVAVAVEGKVIRQNHDGVGIQFDRHLRFAPTSSLVEEEGYECRNVNWNSKRTKDAESASGRGVAGAESQAPGTEGYAKLRHLQQPGATRAYGVRTA